ncbi:ribbon-helix-helix domain-containing protein [Sphingomonas sp. 37zxx]|uniref:ribbon-helix-helix domain-containing protein n=1 Tax=Sphingomonas sp. 37zxx TaxID=1550073 RepID=UPI00053BF60E|nr:ribbon-helix-helix domain-containing protein [Sphingomonas sp. 37zxx]
MSRKPSFANLRDRAPALASVPQPNSEPASVTAADRVGEGASIPQRPASREGRKQIAGFFTPEMSLAMHMLARRQDRSLQALMAEAFNDVLRKYGESPIGE